MKTPQGVSPAAPGEVRRTLNDGTPSLQCSDSYGRGEARGQLRQRKRSDTEREGGLTWFRCYADLLNDFRLHTLPEEMRFRYIGLLAVQADRGRTETLTDEEFAFRLRLKSEDDARATRVALRQVGLIGETWRPLDWGRICLKSDHDAAERMRRSRLRNRDLGANASVTGARSDGYVTVTDSIRDGHALEQTIAEAEPEPEGEERDAERPTPANGTSLPEHWVPDVEYARNALPQIDVDVEAEKFRTYYLKHGTHIADWAAAWRSWIQRAKESGRYARRAPSIGGRW